MAAVSVTVLVAVAAFTLDLGYAFLTKSRLQATADATALAGLIEIAPNTFTLTAAETAAVVAAAQGFAELNMAALAHGTVLEVADVLIGHWDGDGDYGTARTFYALANLPVGAVINAVQTRTRRSDTNGNPLNLLFSGILGFDDIGVTARAIAAYGIDSVGEACIFALKTDERLGVGIRGTADVDLDCTVVSNSPLDQGGNSCMWTTGIYAVDYIDGDCLYMPDGTDPTVEELGYPKKDPFCRSEELCLGEPENYAGDCTDETTNVTVGPDDTAYLSGNRVYCGDLHIQGTAFFGPGLHHIIGGKFKVNSGAVVHTVSESADVAEAAQNVIDPTDPNYPPENLSYGSTIFLDSVGKNDIFEINGDSSTTLMAPTDASVFYSNNIVGSSELMSGLIGMLFYQTDTADPQAMNKFNGGSELFLDGIVYAPVAECQYNGGSDLDWGYLMLICGTIDFIGTTYINDTPLNGGAADNPYLQDFEYTKLVL